MQNDSVIKGCIKVEKTAAAIYKKLSQLFPEHRDFWKSLFDDEVKHLAFLRDVKSLGLVEDLQKRGPLPPASTIDSTQTLADAIADKAKGPSFSMSKALKMVLNLEESMVEIYTNKIIADLMSNESEMSLKQLVAEENSHIRKIKRMMKAK
ncbi:MAG: hypothetical protein HZA16_15400 [Nitrospirae bacterium]|nr:hypothetical protein [Nitrospirota bacterium]